MMMVSCIAIGTIFLYTLTRVWFIINVRDWRDELADKGDAGKVEMRTRRKVGSKPID